MSAGSLYKPDSLSARGYSSDSSRPIDLVHLGVQTQGDSELEQEVLSIFVVQSRAYLEIIRNSNDQASRKRAAHSLKGSSRSVGAFKLGAIAEALEAGDISRLEEAEDELKNVLEFMISFEH